MATATTAGSADTDTRAAGGRRRGVDRIRPDDLVELASDVGPVPMNVGIVLQLDGGATPDRLERVLADRLRRVPRLCQRLVRPPAILGRPYWVDDDGFDLGHHVGHVVTASEDDAAVLAVATEAVTQPLPPTRPLWRAVVVTDRAGRPVAVVLVVHHVVTDGVAGLAVLERLLDGGAADPAPLSRGTTGRPATLDLLLDTTADRWRRVSEVPASLRRLFRGGVELGLVRRFRGAGRRRARAQPGGHRLTTVAPRCSLNAPTGPHRRVAAVDVPLGPLVVTARAHGCTVNDLLLVAVTSAMACVLDARGEHPDRLVVSVPVSGRASASEELGNQVGVMPVSVPLTGSPSERLTAVADLTRARKRAARGASSAVIGPAFRVLVRLGAFRPLVDRQRLVNTFLTNVRGPAGPLAFDGAAVRRLTPITITAGNVGVAFAALSASGRLVVTVMTDPDVVPEIDDLVAALGLELRAACPPDARLTAVPTSLRAPAGS